MSDTYKRKFIDDLAQCGCRWESLPPSIGTGQMIVECPIHQQATHAKIAQFESDAEFDRWLLRALR